MQLERQSSKNDAIDWQRFISAVHGSAAAEAWFAFKHNAALEDRAISFEAGDLLEEGQDAAMKGNLELSTWTVERRPDR